MNMRIFVRDFVRTFVFFALSAFFMVSTIIIESLLTFKKFTHNVIVPLIFELGHDFKLFSMVFVQGFCDVMSSVFLNISKITLKASQYFHNKSENLITKYWDVF